MSVSLSVQDGVIELGKACVSVIVSSRWCHGKRSVLVSDDQHWDAVV